MPQQQIKHKNKKEECFISWACTPPVILILKILYWYAWGSQASLLHQAKWCIVATILIIFGSHLHALVICFLLKQVNTSQKIPGICDTGWEFENLTTSSHFKSLQLPLSVNNSPWIISSDPCAFLMTEVLLYYVWKVSVWQCGPWSTLCYFVPWDLSPLPPAWWCLWQSPSNSQSHSRPSTLGSAHSVNTLTVCGNLPIWER